MLPYGDKLNLKNLFAEEKSNHLHAMLCQETSDTRHEDKEQKTWVVMGGTLAQIFLSLKRT